MKKSIIVVAMICVIAMAFSLMSSAFNNIPGDRLDTKVKETSVTHTQGVLGVIIEHDDNTNRHGYVGVSIVSNGGTNFQKSSSSMALNIYGDFAEDDYGNDCWTDYQSYADGEHSDSFSWSADDSNLDPQEIDPEDLDPNEYDPALAKEIYTYFSVVRYYFQNNEMHIDGWTDGLDYKYVPTLTNPYGYGWLPET